MTSGSDSTGSALDELIAEAQLLQATPTPLRERRLGDGRHLHVLPLLHGMAQLCVATPQDMNEASYTDLWHYETVADAIEAFNEWDGIGEPDGWHRHPESGRRRPDGDATREYTRK